MKVLIDTSTFIWLDSDRAKIPPNVRSLLESEGIEVQLSMASVWEMAIKRKLGKLSSEKPLLEVVGFYRESGAISVTPILLEHVALVETLPLHHRDPFDRLIGGREAAHHNPRHRVLPLRHRANPGLSPDFPKPATPGYSLTFTSI